MVFYIAQSNSVKNSQRRVKQHSLRSKETEVDDVDVYNYTNLGKLDRPLASSVATAIGNNKSIVVKVPAVQ